MCEWVMTAPQSTLPSTSGLQACYQAQVGSWLDHYLGFGRCLGLSPESLGTRWVSLSLCLTVHLKTMFLVICSALLWPYCLTESPWGHFGRACGRAGMGGRRVQVENSWVLWPPLTQVRTTACSDSWLCLLSNLFLEAFCTCGCNSRSPCRGGSQRAPTCLLKPGLEDLGGEQIALCISVHLGPCCVGTNRLHMFSQCLPCSGPCAAQAMPFSSGNAQWLSKGSCHTQ